MAANLNSENISKITDAEKKLTGSQNPVRGGPTAQAQSNAGEPINSQTLHDITEGEKKVTGSERPVKGGPTSVAQSILSGGDAATSGNTETQTGNLDSSTIHNITEAEKKLTGSDQVVAGGPTAKAQSHAGQSINSQTLHDITEGEKKVTGGDRVAGGPTATAQSELAKSRT
ncbi:hypothetical protein LTR70_002120 [Exophiala xenobiotica]|uniref:Uncharacterized protein n=1 Tax=Lithohypha guttulata TaxID=1690604 RepID=A0ABR0K397_9EURO|nr:hypothetical protein LTR24_007358 [Lithohypha guttulata]KAK5326120.1 hypothetical protein LTR70_002120 [Exophiala xenobiotica]